MSRPLSSLGILIVILMTSVCGGCGASTPPKNVPPKDKTPVAKFATADVKPGTPPETILFPNDYGDSTFTHVKHIERVKGDCTVCHPKVFPQELKQLGYGKSRHRTAEEFMTSCAACHAVTATAFAAERNCQKCHEMVSSQH